MDHTIRRATRGASAFYEALGYEPLLRRLIRRRM